MVNFRRRFDRQSARRVRHHWGKRGATCVVAVLVSTLGFTALATTPALAGVTLNGVGSSFAAPAVEQWATSVSQSPYNLGINYSSTSSGDGRYEFTNQTTDFAVSDIAYGLGSTDTTAPSFKFDYIPITAGGIAFMYNIPGLTKPLQLTSYTACAILTGGITNWDNSALETGGANAGSNLSSINLGIVPVTESDSAGTNYVLEEWCIEEQPALWASFANHENSQSGGPTDGVAISATAPNSNWPGIPSGLDDQNTSQVAGDVAANNGTIGAVQVKYATDDSFGSLSGSDPNPAHGVAFVENTSGDYTFPVAVNVASALAYATQLPNGTHKLNFGGMGPHVYNPSTYSYLLTPTTGWTASKGAVMSAFVNYALTLGQQQAPSFDYASLGLSLEQFGITEVKSDVPGAVGLTSSEQSGYSCGDLTPAEVAAGQTSPTCGVTNTTVPQPTGTTGTTGTASATTTKTSTPGTASPTTGTASASTGTTKTSTGGTSSSTTGSRGSSSVVSASGGSGSSSSGGGSVGGSGTSSGADPAVSLTGAPSTMASTGSNTVPIAVVGAVFLVAGWLLRRRLLRPKSDGAG